ncbi:hypothetical protein [Paenibacillus alba]|uniref:Uncharacterized protein n=1 Tax=Paenibacillus alba TaxID=1197127 RepID=A0ABU6G186_9BACL|nr:hypothetical protein [Paenibacillus alba]MEC0226633.1 hypothetical protein [Paenibacillus alba]
MAGSVDGLAGVLIEPAKKAGSTAKAGHFSPFHVETALMAGSAANTAGVFAETAKIAGSIAKAGHFSPFSRRDCLNSRLSRQYGGGAR